MTNGDGGEGWDRLAELMGEVVQLLYGPGAKLVLVGGDGPSYARVGDDVFSETFRGPTAGDAIQKMLLAFCAQAAERGQAAERELFVANQATLRLEAIALLVKDAAAQASVNAPGGAS